MQPSIGRWLWNTIALPVCVGHPNLANSTSAWKKNSGRLPTMRSGCTGRVPRRMRAIRRLSSSRLVVSSGAEPRALLLACFRLLAEAWPDTTTAHGRLMPTVLGGLRQ
jgi:hypothetical protein